MPEYSFKKREPIKPLPFILFAGIILGIILARNPAFLYHPAPVLSPPTPMEDRPTSTAMPTAETFNVIKITPETTTSTIAQVGKPAPDFILKSLQGSEIKLSDQLGKPVLINLWASWCPPCRLEMPGIQTAYEKYKNRGLVVLGIDFMAQDNLQDVSAFVDELQLTFPILLDESGDISAGLYGMRGLPTSYFIDTQGILQRIQVGAMLPEKLEEYLLEILPK